MLIYNPLSPLDSSLVEIASELRYRLIVLYLPYLPRRRLIHPSGNDRVGLRSALQLFQMFDRDGSIFGRVVDGLAAEDCALPSNLMLHVSSGKGVSQSPGRLSP